AAAVAGLGAGRVAAGRGRLTPPGRQRARPRAAVPGVRARTAAPRPGLDRRGDDRAVPLRRHAADGAAARDRRVVAVAPGRRGGGRGGRVRVPPPGPEAAAAQVQLGDRRGAGRTRSPRRGRGPRPVRTGRPGRRAGAVAAAGGGTWGGTAVSAAAGRRSPLIAWERLQPQAFDRFSQERRKPRSVLPAKLRG